MRYLLLAALIIVAACTPNREVGIGFMGRDPAGQYHSRSPNGYAVPYGAGLYNGR